MVGTVIKSVFQYLFYLFDLISALIIITLSKFQKLLEVEDLVEDERKEKGGKIESLESIVRMLELKAKNSSDHGNQHL